LYLFGSIITFFSACQLANKVVCGSIELEQVVVGK
jgi:hypothetical protein